MSGFRSSVSWVMMHMSSGDLWIPPCPSVVCFFCTCGAPVLHCILCMQATQHCACHSTLLLVQDSASPPLLVSGWIPIHPMASIPSWVMTHGMASPCWTSPPHDLAVLVDVVQYPAIHRQIALWPSPVLRYFTHLTTRHYLHTMGSTPYSCRRKV